MKYQIIFETILGKFVLIEENRKIVKAGFAEKENKNVIEKETSLLHKAKEELLEFLDGRRREFDIPLMPTGTPFQRKVWEELKKIPYGETRSYQDIAIAIGNPKASRAVGMANNRNPIGIFIPCHRVIGKNGRLVGYAGGVLKKEKLLQIECQNKNENVC